MASDDQDPPAGPTETQRLDALEAEQKKQGGTLDTILGILQGKKTGTPPAPGPDPGTGGGQTSIADEIARQLDERDARDKAAKNDKDQADWRAGVDAKLAGMTESAPEAPVRRIEQRMGWR